MPGSIEKHMPGCKRLGLSLDHVGRLVRGHADAVPRAVQELLAVAGLGDDAPTGAVDLLTGHARPDGLETGLLGSANDVVDLALLFGWFADVDRA